MHNLKNPHCLRTVFEITKVISSIQKFCSDSVASRQPQRIASVPNGVDEHSRTSQRRNRVEISRKVWFSPNASQTNASNCINMHSKGIRHCRKCWPENTRIVWLSLTRARPWANCPRCAADCHSIRRGIQSNLASQQKTWFACCCLSQPVRLLSLINRGQCWLRIGDRLPWHWKIGQTLPNPQLARCKAFRWTCLTGSPNTEVFEVKIVGFLSKRRDCHSAICPGTGILWSRTRSLAAECWGKRLASLCHKSLGH